MHKSKEESYVFNHYRKLVVQNMMAMRDNRHNDIT